MKVNLFTEKNFPNVKINFRHKKNLEISSKFFDFSLFFIFLLFLLFLILQTRSKENLLSKILRTNNL